MDYDAIPRLLPDGIDAKTIASWAASFAAEAKGMSDEEIQRELVALRDDSATALSALHMAQRGYQYPSRRYLALHIEMNHRRLQRELAALTD